MLYYQGSAERKSIDLSFLESEQVRRNKRAKTYYLNCCAAFDIETSTLPDLDQAFMYIWQIQIEDQTIVGRTWPAFLDLIDYIAGQLPDNVWMPIYVHNLSFEFSFLKGIYAFKNDEVFATEPRKVLKCMMKDHIEFRCSYYLTGLSLDMFLKKYNVPNKKLTYDYKKVRYPWTELSEEELAYCVNDVKGLVQALHAQIKADGDNMATIPGTLTGYPRKDTRKAMYRFNHIQLKQMLPDVEVYCLEREAYRGGDTLSNRWNTDEIIHNIQGVDIASSYPASMMLNPMPMGPFRKTFTSKFWKLYHAGRKAMLFRVEFYGLHTRTQFEGHLYLSKDKCRDMVNPTCVNGRILCANYLETTLTDVDFGIVERRYDWERMRILVLYTATYKMLPSMFRDVIMEYYRVKTELKGSPEGSDDAIFYSKNKSKLNSCYGMCVQDPGKDNIRFDDGEFIIEDKPLAELLDKFNSHAFLNYAWGVWIAAWSRKRLADGIDVVTKNGTEPMNFIYSDTDSIKYTGDVDFGPLNAQIQSECEYFGAYAADKDGVVHYMGVWEDEGYKLPNRFKTLGAKKYVLEDPDRKLHITIAGVNKKLGAAELGSIENFQEGFTFRKAGGTEAKFNDNVCFNIEVDNHNLVVTDNVVIKDSTYTIGLTAEYRAVLDGLIMIKYSDHDIPGLFKVKR